MSSKLLSKEESVKQIDQARKDQLKEESRVRQERKELKLKKFNVEKQKKDMQFEWGIEYSEKKKQDQILQDKEDRDAVFKMKKEMNEIHRNQQRQLEEKARLRMQ